MWYLVDHPDDRAAAIDVDRRDAAQVDAPAPVQRRRHLAQRAQDQLDWRGVCDDQHAPARVLLQQRAPAFADALRYLGQAFAAGRLAVQRVGEALHGLVRVALAHLAVGQPLPAAVVRLGPALVGYYWRNAIGQDRLGGDLSALRWTDDRDFERKTSQPFGQRARLPQP